MNLGTSNFRGKAIAHNTSSSSQPQLITSQPSGDEKEGAGCIEKEHMFDKVVTPSDVGKLNRLVIPKQHAEKYFPLDSSSCEKGLLLNFQDRNGKAWRFRYSYWNSSQSYVMTKGWSRFVKDKKLEAGDIVSFQRGLHDSSRDLLFIDWKRRAAHIPDFPLHRFPLAVAPWPFPNFNGNGLVLSRSTGFNHCNANAVNPVGGSLIYVRSPEAQARRQPVGMGTLVYDSVPVVHGKAAAKRLRLFGVNMDCPISADPDHHYHTSSSSASAISSTALSSHATLVPQPAQLSSASAHQWPLHLRLHNGAALSPTHDFLNQGKSSSPSLDLDL